MMPSEPPPIIHDPPAIIETMPPAIVESWPRITRDGEGWYVTLQSGQWFRFDKTWKDKTEAEVLQYVANYKPPAKPAAPVVAAPKTFQNGSWHVGHACPVCGQQRWVIDGGSANGVHTHVCQSCGAWWVHAK